MKFVLITLCFVFGYYSQIDGAKTNSLLNPPWTHCVIQLHALANKWEEVTSPDFPNGITKQTQCTWIISSNPNQRIRLAFQTMNLTGSVDNCYTQFLQIIEIKAVNGKHDRGKFCGDRRPGDYVSYGFQLRLDLMADTAASGHQGFQIKYKAIKKDPPGFKSVFSFTNKKPKNKTKPKKKKNKAKTTTSPSKSGGNPNSKFPPSTPGNGGKVNLNSLQKQREQLANKPKFVGNNTRILAKNPIRKPPIPNKYDMPVRDKRPGKTTIVVNDGKEEPEFNIYLVVGIPVCGLVILVLIGVVIKLCIFDKRKKQKKEKKEMEYEKKNSQFSPLNAVAHPIQRLNHLPGAIPTQPAYNPNYNMAYNQQPQGLQHPQQLQYHNQASRMHSSAPFNRATKAQAPHAPPNRSHKTPSPISMINDDVILGNEVAMGDEAKHHVNNDVIGEHMYTNNDGGFVYYYPANQNGAKTMPPNYNAVTSNHWQQQNGETEVNDEQGYQTKTLPARTQSKRSVPTLKRKISQWEKSEIKKGNFI